MKANEALIAWTPINYQSRIPEKMATRGMVQVGPLLKRGDHDWAARFGFTGGASFTKTRHFTGSDSLAQLFIEFHTLVVRDGIEPKVAHDAFLVIDEYREVIPHDIRGSDRTDWL